jgi:hypothetical protein
MDPTLAGFLEFVRTVMGISSSVLPDNSPYLAISFNVSKEIVNPTIQQASPLLYQSAVYNLAGDSLLNFAQDQAGKTFFADARAKFTLLDFTPGVVQSTGDEGTNTSLIVQKAAEEFTLANLQQLKTPYGRAYLQIAQSYGPNIWGVS